MHCSTDAAALSCRGTPIPYLRYTDAELRVWQLVLAELQRFYPTHACREFLQGLPLLHFTQHVVPQLEPLSRILKCAHARAAPMTDTQFCPPQSHPPTRSTTLLPLCLSTHGLGSGMAARSADVGWFVLNVQLGCRQRTGWQIRPVAGLLHPRDFLNGLAFRCFHSTQAGSSSVPLEQMWFEQLCNVPVALLVTPWALELAACSRRCMLKVGLNMQTCHLTLGVLAVHQASITPRVHARA